MENPESRAEQVQMEKGLQCNVRRYRTVTGAEPLVPPSPQRSCCYFWHAGLSVQEQRLTRAGSRWLADSWHSELLLGCVCVFVGDAVTFNPAVLKQKSHCLLSRSVPETRFFALPLWRLLFFSVGNNCSTGLSCPHRKNLDEYING